MVGVLDIKPAKKESGGVGREVNGFKEKEYLDVDEWEIQRCGWYNFY